MPNFSLEISKLSKKYKIGSVIQRDTLRDEIADIFSGIKNGQSIKRKTNLADNEFWALRNISFNVRPGEVLGVIGMNGSGKSTLLKVLSKITPPTSGMVTLNGKVASMLEVGTGFSPELTGRENIYLNGAIMGMTRREIDKRFSDIVEFSGVAQFLDTPVKHYSSGMYMRLGFSVAAYLKPDILLVDEVLSVGDTQFQEKSLGKMHEVANEGRTVLFVSHNLGAVASLCNRVLVLDKGTISYIGNVNIGIGKYLKLISAKSDRVQRSNKIVRKATLTGMNLSTVSERVGNILDFVIDLNLPESDLSVDLIIKSNDVPVCFAGSAYYNPIRLSKETKRIKCTLGPINFASGKYTVDINIAKPNEFILETNSRILTFNVDNISYNSFNFSLGIQHHSGYIVPNQIWKNS